MFNLILAKIVDEDRPDDEELSFQWRDGDTDIDQLSTPIEQQQQLKISSSSSNILMDNKLMGNVQVSQV